MTAPHFPIDELEPAAGDALAAGAPEWLVPIYSIAVSFRRIADAAQLDEDEFRRRVFAALDAGEPAQ